jgi:ABC-type proline/glycine betaine transport system permease subunit
MSVSEAISVVFAIPPVARITPIGGASIDREQNEQTETSVSRFDDDNRGFHFFPR